MKQCPSCHAMILRTAFRTRVGGMRIAIECATCGHVGPEIPLTSMDDHSAARAACMAWESQASRLIVGSVARH